MHRPVPDAVGQGRIGARGEAGADRLDRDGPALFVPGGPGEDVALHLPVRLGRVDGGHQRFADPRDGEIGLAPFARSLGWHDFQGLEQVIQAEERGAVAGLADQGQPHATVTGGFVMGKGRLVAVEGDEAEGGRHLDARPRVDEGREAQ